VDHKQKSSVQIKRCQKFGLLKTAAEGGVNRSKYQMLSGPWTISKKVVCKSRCA